jgi:hypothetical protein
MTPLELLDALKAFIEENTKDILLPVRVDRKIGEAAKERPAEVYKMRLPTKDAETKRIPYVLLQYIKSTDTQTAGEMPESSCMVRIVAATYSEDGEEGALCVLNLLTRIRIAFLRDGVIAERFMLKPPIEMIVYPDSTPPYYLGEMMTEWRMPIVESEVQKVWQ